MSDEKRIALRPSYWASVNGSVFLFSVSSPAKAGRNYMRGGGIPQEQSAGATNTINLTAKNSMISGLLPKDIIPYRISDFARTRKSVLNGNDWKKGSKNIRWRKTALLKMIFGNGQKQCLYLIIITKSTNGADVCTALCPLISLSPTFTNTIPPISLLCSKKCGKRKQCEKESLVDRFRLYRPTRNTTLIIWKISSRQNGLKSLMTWRNYVKKKRTERA